MIDGQKMSKSLGNVISPKQLVDSFGVDGSRYLIARSFPSENDSDVGLDRFKEKYNADLANNLGNLISRITKLAEGLEVKKEIISFDSEFESLVDDLKLDEAINLVYNKWIDTCNLKLNQDEPWKLDRNDIKRTTLLVDCIKSIQTASFHLQIIMPEVARRIDNCFENKIKILDNPLFPRIK